ncbi:hypothetical protein [Verrucosispora sioxanthis]|uniref:hypothetical protein n=1 Tax=Verrucosispora sioxanthis TaxID=2499994 RepID=UPI001C10E132|nr:hypothetical protein [Verrucosispora sioxanthis]
MRVEEDVDDLLQVGGIDIEGVRFRRGYADGARKVGQNSACDITSDPSTSSDRRIGGSYHPGIRG